MPGLRNNRLLAGLGLSLLAGIAAAAPHFTATVQATSGTMNIPGQTDYQSGAGATPLTFSAASSQRENFGPGGMAQAEGSSAAFASAVPGALRVSAASGGVVQGIGSSNMSAQGGGGANASLDDAFTILASQCGNLAVCGNGAVGSLSFSIVAHGQIGGSGGPASGVGGQWTADFSLTTGSVPNPPLATSVAWHADHAISMSDNIVTSESWHDGFGTKTFTVSFVFGTPINLHMAASATSLAGASFIYGSNSAGFVTDLSHTLGWGGISGVTDAAGNAIGYSALGASGFNFAQPFTSPVPEPASLLMMGVGLLALLTLSRRRPGAARRP
ncbi:PEP-CTERM sorting domain-containing protein [Roseateles sp. NT4]|uniref:PEP-CTERM sorting domain-containing protein n=1 Tax=Roseateles sp. NT4 TaxID=3453715 RepID=UPI003EECC57B